MLLFRETGHVLLEVFPGDLHLILEYVATEQISQALRFGIEETRPHRSLMRPGMLGKGEIVQVDRYMMGARGFPYQWISSSTVRALHVLKHHNRHLGSRGRL